MPDQRQPHDLAAVPPSSGHPVALVQWIRGAAGRMAVVPGVRCPFVKFDVWTVAATEGLTTGPAYVGGCWHTPLSHSIRPKAPLPWLTAGGCLGPEDRPKQAFSCARHQANPSQPIGELPMEKAPCRVTLTLCCDITHPKQYIKTYLLTPFSVSGRNAQLPTSPQLRNKCTRPAPFSRYDSP